MKRLFLAIFFCLHFFSSSSQNCWLPEQFVNAIMAKDTNANKYLVPVEGIEHPFSNGFILTYGGELIPLYAKKVIVNGKQKYQLPSAIYSQVNLMYNSRELVNKIQHSKIYLSKENKRLLLEIVNKGKIEKIYFINKVGDYWFTNIRDSIEYLNNKWVISKDF